jgi:energy-coupling factor transporter transmembrane protein EcfT
MSELKFLSIFLVLICLTRSISTPGFELYNILGIGITREGLESGLLICWKLILVVVLGVLFIQGSQTFELKSAIQWFLAPLPYVNEKQTAILLSLMLRFLPSIIHEAEEIRQAQYSRCVDLRLNPFYRITNFIKPLVQRVLGSVDELADAMESRNYCAERTEYPLVFSRRDGMALVLVFGYGLGVIGMG